MLSSRLVSRFKSTQDDLSVGVFYWKNGKMADVMLEIYICISLYWQSKSVVLQVTSNWGKWILVVDILTQILLSLLTLLPY